MAKDLSGRLLIYQHKTVCPECVDTDQETFSVTQADVDADPRL